MTLLTDYRKLFPITERVTFLNHAGTAPIGLHTEEAVAAFAAQRARQPFDLLSSELQHIHRRLREQLASLINAARPDEIVLLPSTSVAINTAANSLPLRAGDNVIVLDGDYPADIYPWHNLARRGVEVRLLPAEHGGLALDTLLAHIDGRTRVVNISSVMFASGFYNDLQAVGQICAERGIFFVVDATQSVGLLPMDVQALQIDMLACSAHKWLLGEVGTCLFYCRHGLIEQLQPGAYVGTYSVVDAHNYLEYDFTLQPNAERFNLGNPNWQGIVTLAASLRLLAEIGVEAIGTRVLALTDLLIDDLRRRGYPVRSSLDPSRRSGIVIVEVNEPKAAHAGLLEQGIVTAIRGAGIRISPHFYNSEDEVLRVGTALDRLGQRPRNKHRSPTAT
jgi:cysteine desulfurase / selenocysteine lyase